MPTLSLCVSHSHLVDLQMNIFSLFFPLQMLIHFYRSFHYYRTKQERIKEHAIKAILFRFGVLFQTMCVSASPCCVKRVETNVGHDIESPQSGK